MNAKEILVQARANVKESDDWAVFPLLRRQVIGGLAGWIFGVLLGSGLLAIAVPAIIPYNYERGVASIIFATLLLAAIAFIAIGSVVLLIVDIYRLIHADEHMIVITNENFVKQEGKKIIHVPLANVRHVTPRGRAPIDRSTETEQVDVKQIPGIGESTMGFLFGRGMTSSGMRWRRKGMRTPTSLAFIDARTNTEVTVVNDQTYGDPFIIAAVLKKYIASI